MTFRVGQKVVCVGMNENPTLSEAAQRVHHQPNLNTVYTVRSIFSWSSLTLIRLREIDNTHLMPIMRLSIEPGYNALGFRPIVERETDISALKALLVPGAKILETA